jgi:hypothetical protein
MELNTCLKGELVRHPEDIVNTVDGKLQELINIGGECGGNHEANVTTGGHQR